MTRFEIYISAPLDNAMLQRDTRHLADALERAGHVVPLQWWLRNYHIAELRARDTVDQIARSDVFVWLAPPSMATASELGVAIAAHMAWQKPFVITVNAEISRLPIATLGNKNCETLDDVLREIDRVRKVREI